MNLLLVATEASGGEPFSSREQSKLVRVGDTQAEHRAFTAESPRRPFHLPCSVHPPKAPGGGSPSSISVFFRKT